VRKPEPDLYRVLGVPHDAVAADITSAYRRQARAWHPDMVPAAAGAAARFRAVAEAYQVLSDPAQRAGYDRARQGHAVPGPARPGRVASPAGVRPAGRGAAGIPHLTAAPALWAGPVRVDPLPRTTADVSPHRPEDPAPTIWAAARLHRGECPGWPW
jgi:curved DNA-binding protein CbpA